jgi:tetratricopeptide (TPR) repeat protein
VYGHYLIDRGDAAGARKQLELAREKARDDANLSYNLGLAYFDLKDYALAREYAKRAYELGFPLEGLKKKLQQAGQWPG